MKALQAILGFAKNVKASSQLFVVMLHAAVYLAASILLINYLTSFLSATAADRLGYDVHFSIAGVSSLQNTTGWCARYIGLVFTSAPLAAFSMLLLSLILIRLTPIKNNRMRLFLFQLAIASFAYFYSHILAGLIYQLSGIPRFFMGFVALFTWLRWEEGTITVVLGLLGLISSFFSVFWIPALTRLSPSRRLLSIPSLKTLLVMGLMVGPAFIGFILVISSTFPYNNDYHLLQMISIIWLSITTIFFLSLYGTNGITLVKPTFSSTSFALILIQSALIIVAGRYFLIKAVDL